ncbi:MAG: DNA polymerase III subunit gamma/tau [Mycoplasmatales bacterium]|nr:DNA polymerase III subunit gamma/tau [Mycoplasmatales bacterium]
MSYKALYRTYRPRNFDEVIGQNHIVSTLRNIIKNNKIGHAYLFAGPRGTGKTSVAHVFARAVNVNAANEEVYGDMDIIEIDAASNNGVSEVRTLIDNVNYAPNIAKYKVYIIDEVHMLTKGAFNALLKTLEEPPAHVIFILATTEPHKIPITILSRTQRFNFKRIEDKLIAKQLMEVLTKENIKYDDDSIKFISKLAQGGMRDALSIADQSSAFGNGIINFESISQVFGIISTQHQIELLNKAYNGEARELMKITNKFLDNGVDIERVSSSLLEIIKDFIIFKKTSDINLLSFLTLEEVESLELDVNFAYEAVDVLMKLITDLRFTSVPRQSFELSMLKVINKNAKPKNNQMEMENDLKLNNKVVKKEIDLEEISKEEEENIRKTPIEKIEEIPPLKEKVVVEETNQEEKIDSLFNDQEFTPEQVPPNEEKLENEAPKNNPLEKDILVEKKILDQYSNNSEQQLEAADEINVDIVQQEAQYMSEMDDIDNDVLTTQEIPVGELQDKTKTSEIDVMKLFDSSKNETNFEEESTSQFTVNEIINLLVQAKRDILSSAKTRWSDPLSVPGFEPKRHYLEMISHVKIISAGEKFVLVASMENDAIERVNAERLHPEFLVFLENLLGRRVLLFGITKDEFEEIKKQWSHLSSTDSLPIPREIEIPKLQEKEKTEQENYGESLFGELFSS